MTPDPKYLRRLRTDRIGHLSSATAAALLLLTALMLVSYLLLSLRLLVPSNPISSAQQVAWSTARQFVQVAVDARPPATAVLIGEHEIQALELADAMRPAAMAGNANAALQQADRPLWLPLGQRQLLVLDAAAGVGLLRWSGSNNEHEAQVLLDKPAVEDSNGYGQGGYGPGYGQGGYGPGYGPGYGQGSQQLTAQLDWTPFPPTAQRPANADQRLLLAGLSTGAGHRRLLTLWQHQAGASLRWYALQMQPTLVMQLLREVSLDSIRVLATDRPGSSGANIEITAADITSLLPDQSDNAYLGLASGMLLQLAADTPQQSRLLPAIAGAALTSLISLPQSGVLAAHADGSISEFSRSRDSGLVLANVYQCGKRQLSAITVDQQQRWLACVGDDILRLFYLDGSGPVWQTDVLADEAGPAATMLALESGVLLLLRATAAGTVSVQHWLFEPDPVVDMHTLWWPQHYPGEAQPTWQWEPQASMQSAPRLSLMPLLAGTFKAALLGMLIAVPLAMFGAIYTALLLPQRWRERIKPLVEMLESLPTVILGFIGALWLAPLLQQHLLSLWLLLLLLPVTLALSGYYWTSTLKYRVAAGWQPLFPYLLFAAQLLLLVALGMLLQRLLFVGSFSAWLETAADWTYDLHNALLVGLVLGLGIVPVIFALVEDALAAVPRRLQWAALALGASRWQTVWQVMLPAAAAGILAAVLIGFGRALGETMIVLMVSSNTPIMESSLLRGLQAIAPTLASEMPQTGANSVHFRVLLFAALVLFGFTFVMNSVAELFRSRLRLRYQS